MKKFIIGLFVGMAAVMSVVVVVGVVAAEKLYTLRPVTSFETDPLACAKDGGRAGMIADIDENGFLASEWAYVCVLEVLEK